MPSSFTFLTMFYAPVLVVSAIYIFLGVRGQNARDRVLTTAAAVGVMLACIYLAPMLFAVVSGASLGLMLGTAVSAKPAFLIASLAAIVACSLACLLTQAATRSVVKRAAT